MDLIKFESEYCTERKSAAAKARKQPWRSTLPAVIVVMVCEGHGHCLAFPCPAQFFEQRLASK